MKKFVSSCVLHGSLPLQSGEDAPSTPQKMRIRGVKEIITQEHLQTYTQESGEPGYCSAL